MKQNAIQSRFVMNFDQIKAFTQCCIKTFPIVSAIGLLLVFITSKELH
jgi:hypothetical protein